MSDLKTEHTTRRVIENKLLESLEDGEHAAILASEQDLVLIISALAMAGIKSDDPALRKRAFDFANDLRLLRKGAFGK